MKIVVNKCYGGFSLSPAATKRLAELKTPGRKCLFFERDYSAKAYREITEAQATEKGFSWTAFDEIPPKFDPPNDWFDAHFIESNPRDRADPQLVLVVEELGDKANGECAKLRIVEIPDGVDWEISEYDGMEHIAETHRTW